VSGSLELGPRIYDRPFSIQLNDGALQSSHDNLAFPILHTSYLYIFALNRGVGILLGVSAKQLVPRCQINIPEALPYIYPGGRQDKMGEPQNRT
jgi:hypothetical protein